MPSVAEDPKRPPSSAKCQVSRDFWGGFQPRLIDLCQCPTTAIIYSSQLGRRLYSEGHAQFDHAVHGGHGQHRAHPQLPGGGTPATHLQGQGGEWAAA